MAARGRRGFGYLRRLPSGRWQASFVGPDLARHTAPSTFLAKADAEAWLGVQRQRIVTGDWNWGPQPATDTGRPPTFGSYAEQWLATRDLKPRTREGYEHLLARYVLPSFADVPLDKLTPATVRKWWGALPAQHPTARARTYAVLKAILNTAVADEIIVSSPCKIRGAAQSPRAREIRPASIHELELMVSAMPLRLRALALVCAWCALRSGEVLELRRRDIDLAAGTVTVERAVSWVRGQPVVGTPKSAAGRRSVAVPPHVVPALERHLQDFLTADPDALLFPGQDGRAHLQPSTLHRHWRRARSAAGRPDMRLHDLRHTGATMAAMTGATLAELQQRLGHSTVSAAIRYQHAAQGRDQQIAAALSRLAEQGSR